MIRFPERLFRVREPGLNQLLLWVALGFAAAVFLISEFMHYLLVPGLGRHGERMVAEGLSALIVGGLAAKLFSTALERRRATLARLQVISEMNHHIRNALAAISLSAYVTQNQQSIRVISEGVERIEWALREILPRENPLSEPERDPFFSSRWRNPNIVSEAKRNSKV